METGIALLVGLLAGAHTSTWGMFKDCPHEGFAWRKYFRSTLISAALALGWQAAVSLPLETAGARFVLFGLVYVTERGLVELYKTYLREEDQSKYFIPMQFHVWGRVVQSRAVRGAVAAGWVVTVAAVGGGLVTLQQTSLAPLLAVLLFGSVGGWLSAFGGAFKDAPIEGFETFKFFRSPAITGTYAFLISRLDGRMLIVALCALGFTVATIETYKTFFFPSKPRGKFANKPIVYPEWLRYRLRFVPLYVGIWVFVIGAFAQALLSAAPRMEGGTRAQHTAAPSPRPDALEAADAVSALVRPARGAEA
jgi:hypothetical protein